MTTVLIIVAGVWVAVALPVALLFGVVVGLASQTTVAEPDDLCELVQPECWSQAEIRAEFAEIVTVSLHDIGSLS